MVVADFGLSRWSRPGEEQVYTVGTGNNNYTPSSFYENQNDSSHDSGDNNENKNFNCKAATLPRPRLKSVRGRDSQKSRLKSKKLKCVGSPFWMAPEMLAGDDYDKRVDIFSYGESFRKSLSLSCRLILQFYSFFSTRCLLFDSFFSLFVF